MTSQPGDRPYRPRVFCAAWILMMTLAIRVGYASPFATEVIHYDPAPGQFVDDPTFNNPAKALLKPVGGGTSAANNSSVVTLGGFGGSIVLAFDHTVLDDPLNPFGMDAIVFGNAFWVGGDPEGHWAECAVIEICLDANGNGWPDEEEPWYLIAGSHHADLLWTESGFALPDDPFGDPVIWNPSDDADLEGVFGYAEYAPTLLLGDLNADNVVEDPTAAPEEFYTRPDDPIAVGMTAGSGGGDAFDIAWAVDPETDEPANLTGFDFIRITSAVNVPPGPLGEKSPEIDAVADVAPDPLGDADDDGDIDLVDAAALQNCFATDGGLETACDRIDAEPKGVVDMADAEQLISRFTGPR